MAQRQIGAEEESEEGRDKEEEEAEPIQAGLLVRCRIASRRAMRSNPGSVSKGGGSQLPDSVRANMEPRFGVDFSHVRVHTGSDAIQMNRDVGAQAFTHGSDIYYGAGSSPGNLEFTTHELNHFRLCRRSKTQRVL